MMPIPFGYGADLANTITAGIDIGKNYRKRKLLHDMEARIRNAPPNIAARIAYTEKPDFMKSYVFPSMNILSSVGAAATRTGSLTGSLLTSGLIPMTSTAENLSYTFGNVASVLGTVWDAHQERREERHNRHAFQLNQQYAQNVAHGHGNIIGLDLAYNDARNLGLLQGLRIAQLDQNAFVYNPERAREIGRRVNRIPGMPIDIA
jgi:hypothetical protein